MNLDYTTVKVRSETSVIRQLRSDIRNGTTLWVGQLVLHVDDG